LDFPRLIARARTEIGKGEIASLSGMRDDPTMFQVSVPLQPGNSADPCSTFMAMSSAFVVSVLRQSQSVNYAVKSSLLAKLCQRIPGATPVRRIEERPIAGVRGHDRQRSDGDRAHRGYP